MSLLLRGGQVMDPGAGLTGALDVRIRDGLITEVAAGLAPDGDVVHDVTGRLALPGLIDELQDGSFDYEDAHGQHITGRQRFVPTLTLRAVEVWWRGGAR